MKDQPLEVFLTLRDVADELKVSVEFVQQRCVSGRIRSISLNDGAKKLRRVAREWLDDYKRSLPSGTADAWPSAVRQEGPWRWSGSRKRRQPKRG